MSLREQAAADLRTIVEDGAGFGWPIIVTNPVGEAFELTCLSGDIGLTLDPETGVAVVGRKAHASMTFASLKERNAGVPIGLASSSVKPWRVTFKDIGGTSHEYKVTETMPDQTLGLLVVILEAYKP